MARFLFRLLNAAAPPGDHVPDSELVRRFAADRDSAAFELLVRRHADAVWAACRRVLRNEADAEDAFQATFLVLARKAASVRGDCAGGWLHRVAVNAALKLRTSRERELASRERERPEHPTTVAHAPGSPETDELATVVHAELARLPDRYRLPVVLCDLEGHTHAEAARVLNWPVGSVSGRLSRARDILRDRLTRRGLGVPAAGLAVALSPSPTPAGAISTATSLAAGTSAVPPAVSSLSEGVLSAMRTAKLKLTAAVAAGFLGLAGVGTVLAVGQAPVPRAPGEPPAKAADPADPFAAQPRPAAVTPAFTAFPDLDPKGLDDLFAKCPLLFGEKDPDPPARDDTLTKLRYARLLAARAELRVLVRLVQAGRASGGEFPELCNRVAAAANDTYPDAKLVRPWLVERVLVAKWFEKTTAARVAAGTDTATALDRARYARLDAEITLAEWEARPKVPPKVGR